MKRILVMVAAMLMIVACGDDDGVNLEIVPPRLLADVAPENDAEIREFLETHFYNYEDFEEPVDPDFDFKIRIDTIAGENAGKTPLINQVESAVVNVSDFEFGLSQDETDIPHTYYYLIAREGQRDDQKGPSPTIADSVFVQYEGRLLDGRSFDSALNSPIWFDLARIQAPLQGFRGFTEGTSNLSAGGAIMDNGDGTVSVEDFGVGMIIFPSGLGGFNSTQGIIAQYSPLIFLIDLFTINDTDHDNDGIPSIEEDLNGNGYLFDDNTDLDQESDSNFPLVANFLDVDDDGDGTLTRDEINEDGSFRDSDGDGVSDHLDPDS